MGLLRGVWLDCGCADGGHTEALVAWGSARAIGVDREQSRIGQANLRKQENDPTFAQSRQQEDLHNVDGINDAAIAVFSLSDQFEHLTVTGPSPIAHYVLASTEFVSNRSIDHAIQVIRSVQGRRLLVHNGEESMGSVPLRGIAASDEYPEMQQRFLERVDGRVQDNFE